MLRRLLWIGLAVGCVSTPPRDNPYPAREAKAGITWIRPNEVQFHSRLAEFRAPLGPVATGQTARFRLKTAAGRVERVRLVLLDQFIEGNQSSVTWSELADIPMVRTSQPPWDVWEASYAPEYPGTLGYFFVLSRGGNQAVLGNNHDRIPIPYNEVRGTGGTGLITPLEEAEPFGLTAWIPQAFDGPPQDLVYYYIFPDRFRNGNRANDPKPGERTATGGNPIEVHSSWAQPEPFKPGDGRGDEFWNNDFYGGDLEGIIEKLDHIASLGTTMIYMTPIFHAESNHKYDHADYLTIDPAFGDLAVFRRLVQEARKRGIGIMLDASLNHTGADSLYFDRYGKWPGVGAFENERIRTDSPFYDWYIFRPNERNPDRMYQQWANPSLAELAESDSWKDFAFRSERSVSQYWLRQGAAGWRMDVAPWVSDEFWTEWRSTLKSRFPESVLICETWFKASKYLTGTMFDGTMNYIFRAAALDFARGGSPRKFADTLEMLLELYPLPALRRSMSLISSHDVPRALHQLGYRRNTGSIPEVIRKRFLLAVALQYLLPGAPTVYYGDEVGVTGGEDPLNRGPFPWPDTGATWGDWGLLGEYQKLARLRRENPETLVFGSLQFLHTAGILAFLRRGDGGKTLLLLLNNDTEPKTIFVEEVGRGIEIPALSYRTLSLDGGVIP